MPRSAPYCRYKHSQSRWLPAPSRSHIGTRPITGATQGDWVLVDAGDVIVHLFRPEVRDYYDLEGMWSVGSRR